MNEKKQIVKPAIAKNMLTNVNDMFLPQIEAQLAGHNIQFDQYQRTCVINALSAIHDVLGTKKIDWNDQQLDRTNITQTLIRIATLRLNASATPREVYFQLRNVKKNDSWIKQIETGVEGDGNDSILRNFGVDIKKVGKYWLVQEEDEFQYPKYSGFDVIPPTWNPKGKGKVIRAVYPIMKNDGTCEYWIAEREDVKHNLLAHINNNMMNETFGICADRYKATPEQKSKIEIKKKELMDKLKPLSLEEILDFEETKQWISPSWSEPQSRESMIIRKMRNNCTKKIPKDFGNVFVEKMYAEATDETVQLISSEISTNANIGEVVDVEYSQIETQNKSGNDNEKNVDKAKDVESTSHENIDTEWLKELEGGPFER